MRFMGGVASFGDAVFEIGLGPAVQAGGMEHRATIILKKNSVSTDSAEPVMGAAETWFGEDANGMWPSAESSPDVGSRPIHPAPGR
jgi:hypothetical protein